MQSNSPKTFISRIFIWVLSIPVLGRIVENTIESLRFSKSAEQINPLEYALGWILEVVSAIPILGPWLLRRFNQDVVQERDFDTESQDKITVSQPNNSAEQPKTFISRIFIWILSIPVLGRIIENTIESLRFSKSADEINPLEYALGWILEVVSAIPILGPWLLRRFNQDVAQERDFDTENDSELGVQLFFRSIGFLKVLVVAAILVIPTIYVVKMIGSDPKSRVASNSPAESHSTQPGNLEDTRNRIRIDKSKRPLHEYLRLDQIVPETNLTLVDILGKKLKLANALVRSDQHKIQGHEFRLNCCIEIALICIAGQVGIPDDINSGLQSGPDINMATDKLSRLDKIARIVHEIAETDGSNQEWSDLENRLEDFLNNYQLDSDELRMLRKLAMISRQPEFHIKPNGIGNIVAQYQVTSGSNKKGN